MTKNYKLSANNILTGGKHHKHIFPPIDRSLSPISLNLLGSPVGFNQAQVLSPTFSPISTFQPSFNVSGPLGINVGPQPCNKPILPPCEKPVPTCDEYGNKLLTVPTFGASYMPTGLNNRIVNPLGITSVNPMGINQGINFGLNNKLQVMTPNLPTLPTMDGLFGVSVGPSIDLTPRLPSKPFNGLSINTQGVNFLGSNIPIENGPVSPFTVSDDYIRKLFNIATPRNNILSPSSATAFSPTYSTTSAQGPTATYVPRQ